MQEDNIHILRVDGEMHFGNSMIVRETIASIVEEGHEVVKLSLQNPAASAASSLAPPVTPARARGEAYLHSADDRDVVAVMRSPSQPPGCAPAAVDVPSLESAAHDVAVAAAAVSITIGSAISAPPPRAVDSRTGAGGGAARGGAVHAVILDGSRVSTIDLTACLALREAVEAVQARGHVIAMCGFPGRVRDLMRAFGIVALLQPPIMCMNVPSALDAVRPLLVRVAAERRGSVATAAAASVAAAAAAATAAAAAADAAPPAHVDAHVV